MKRLTWMGMVFIISLVFSGQWKYVEASGGTMADAMRETGFDAQTAQWSSTTSQDD